MNCPGLRLRLVNWDRFVSPRLGGPASLKAFMQERIKELKLKCRGPRPGHPKARAPTALSSPGAHRVWSACDTARTARTARSRLPPSPRSIASCRVQCMRCAAMNLIGVVLEPTNEVGGFSKRGFRQSLPKRQRLGQSPLKELCAHHAQNVLHRRPRGAPNYRNSKCLH